MAVVDDKKMWMQIRQALLMIVNALEQELEITPRTSQLRREEKDKAKEQRRNTNG